MTEWNLVLKNNWIIGFMEWLPWMPPLLLSGVFNLVVAYQKLERDCRSPLFNPWRSLGFWFWVVVQLSLPSLLFCFYGKIPSRPKIDFMLYWTAILIGFFFTIFVNANADLGFTSFSVDKFYAFFNKLAYDWIAAAQIGPLTDLRQALEAKLKADQNKLDQGLGWLKAYFNEEDRRLKQQSTDDREVLEILAEVARAEAMSEPEEKVRAAIALVWKVRRKDFPRSIKSFGCDQAFLDEHFFLRHKQKVSSS